MSEHDYFEAWWKKQELGHKADYESDRALRTVALSGWLARSVLTPLPEGREREADALLRRCKNALHDWVNTYAAEMCDEASVKVAHERISEGGGTLAYIATLNQDLRDYLRQSPQEGSGNG